MLCYYYSRSNCSSFTWNYNSYSTWRVWWWLWWYCFFLWSLSKNRGNFKWTNWNICFLLRNSRKCRKWWKFYWRIVYKYWSRYSNTLCKTGNRRNWMLCYYYSRINRQSYSYCTSRSCLRSMWWWLRRYWILRS